VAGETVITIIGNLTADPELRTLSDGNPVASFTIASTPRTYNRRTQQYEDGTALFLRCSAWNDLARHISQSCSKGMRVVAQGRLSQHSYQAHDGSNRTVMELTVDEIGPSLRYATAQVTKQGGHNGYQGGSTYGSTYGNPAGNPPVGPRPATAPSQPPATDPWANGGSG
jgi:single-strand DNA-binding protein